MKERIRAASILNCNAEPSCEQFVGDSVPLIDPCRPLDYREGNRGVCPMLRRLLNIASIVCLVACVALLGMWVRSWGVLRT